MKNVNLLFIILCLFVHFKISAQDTIYEENTIRIVRTKKIK